MDWLDVQMIHCVYIGASMVLFVFWLMAGIVLYTYLGYPVVLWLLSFFTKKKIKDTSLYPTVTLLVAAYNEQEVIERKLTNSLMIDYPKDQLQVMIVADGSDDATAELVESFPDVVLLFEPQRKGKAAAINRAVPFINSEIIILTDANCFLEPGAVKEMIQWFKDESVGGVAGVKKVIETQTEDATGTGEGLYWKYESFLKKMESDFYTVVGAAGELFAIRRSLFVPISEAAITDDFYLSLCINLQQKVIAYAPKAVGAEKASPTYKDEWKRKVRISAGGFQSLFLLPQALNFFKHPRLAFQFFSHRVLRWVACPPALILIFLLNAWMVYSGTSVFYEYTFRIQLIIYSCAALGALLPAQLQSFSFFNIPYYFVFMHAAMLAGCYRYFKGSQTVLWEKAKRSAI